VATDPGEKLLNRGPCQAAGDEDQSRAPLHVHIYDHRPSARQRAVGDAWVSPTVHHAEFFNGVKLPIHLFIPANIVPKTN
jgi:hypothetical protein